MGLLDIIFPKSNPKANVKAAKYFDTFSAYKPVFTSYSGSLYEMELVRSAIHTHATFSAKLKPVLNGSAYANLKNVLMYKPNPFMDTYKFIYRIRTILEMENTAFIVPLLDDESNITGFYPILPSRCEILETTDEQYIHYTFANGKKALIELSKVGILTKFQFKNDFFGESNDALNPTLNLIQTQNQGIIEGIKASASIRFIGRLANVFKPEEIEKQRKAFRSENLAADNNGGIAIVDNKFADIKQIDSKPYVVESSQMELIQKNVYNYFNINENIIQNKFDEDEWNAYYEGAIEPFAIQLSLVLTNMMFTEREIKQGNEVIFTANRLQYASNKTKLEVITQMFDRGFLTHNEGREILNLNPIEDGDKYYIRREYVETDKLDIELNDEEEKEVKKDDN